MKKYSFLLVSLFGLFAFASCMDSNDEPNTDNFLVTSPTSIGEPTTTIGAIKAKYCASSKGSDFARNSSNWYSKVHEDMIIEGVVVANDISGNLYQTLLLRYISDSEDQCIQLKIKNTCLYPYFALGQRLRINLRGLYVGCYSKTPTIGQPYFTSIASKDDETRGNNNLGPMLLELCRTHIELIGQPNPNAPELVPVDLTDADGDAWLSAKKANQTYENCPMLVSVRGNIEEMEPAKRNVPARGKVTLETEPLYEMIDGRLVEYTGDFTDLEDKTLHKIWAPEVLHDDGYGVDRNIKLQTKDSKVVLRTSTENDIAFSPIPDNIRTYTGLLSYYNDWQVQLRTLKDISNE